MPAHRFPPPWSLEGRSAGGADLLQSVWLRATPIEVYTGDLHHVAREASFEAKESDESRNGIGSRWGVVAGGRRIQDSRWSAGRYSDGEHGNYSR
jgi:hypothetical protein